MQYFTITNAFKKVKENFNKINRKLKFIPLTILVFLILLIIISTIFIINFLILPDGIITIEFFLMDIVIFIIFVFFLERFLYKRENCILETFESGKKCQPKKRNIISAINTIFKILEDFPYNNKIKGKKKLALQVLGWIFIIIIFSFSTYYRMAVVEFAFYPINNTFRQWTIYFGFNIFSVATGAFIIYLFSRSNPHKVFKLSIFGVALMIQIPAMIDFILIKMNVLPIDTLPYGYIHWDDFFKAFYTMLLHPDLKYAVGFGHTVMIIVLLLFTSLYVAIKRFLFFRNCKSNKKYIFISSRIFLNTFLMYSQVLFSAISAFLITLLVNFVAGVNTNLIYFTINNLYFDSLFLYLVFLVIYDYYKKAIHKKHSENKNSQFKNNKLIIKLGIKLGIIILFVILFQIYNYLIIWILPSK
ncbi:MAG: hypothetical protein ACTSPY_15065 [Candidatus Helarchaeota archaeon]